LRRNASMTPSMSGSGCGSVRGSVCGSGEFNDQVM
jgi:hypothetical protein